MSASPSAYRPSQASAAAVPFAPAHIEIGPGTREIEVPRVDSALADELSVHADNPWYSTDGFCLFDKSGTALIRCLTNVRDYRVPEGCARIDDEAFAYNTVIESVALPDGLLEIGDRAFIDTTIGEVSVPASVQRIGKEAFAEGKRLSRVVLAEGLEEIGDRAFAECRHLRALNVPASVRHLGRSVFEYSGLVAHGEGAGLSVDAGNGRYFIDASGVLYRRGQRGLTLIAALDPIAGTYQVLDGTVRIEDKAFARNRSLARIGFPASLRAIGERAFIECSNLTSAELPDGLVSIGGEAFYHTRLAHIRIPASLEQLGPACLVIGMNVDAGKGNDAPLGGRGQNDFYKSALSGRVGEIAIPRLDVEVDPANARYSLDSGFLCEQPADGGPVRAVQYVGGGDVVKVPRDITHIAAYALFGIEDARELRLHTGIEHVGHSALALSYPLDAIQVDDGAEPPVRLYPAQNSAGATAQRKAFRSGMFDLHQLVSDCDSSLSFMTPGNDRTRRMLMRLANGRRLTDDRRAEFERTVRICTDQLVRLFARTDDREGIMCLLDGGFIDEGNIARAIEVATDAQGVAIARLLLEQNEERFARAALDFDL